MTHTATRPLLGIKDAAAKSTCRSCGGYGLEPVLDLGVTALVDSPVPAERLKGPEPKYPLRVGFCKACALVQVIDTIPNDEVFHEDYAYFSSFSETLLEHSRKNALALIDRHKLNKDSLVVELASNDGYLLKNFVEKGIPVLGIDPSPGPVAAARKIGVTSMCEFFGVDLAKKLVAEGKRADVIIANNVMAHVPDLNGFIAGIARMLKEDGELVTESPWVKDLVEHCEFDTIYHEHLCYYSVTALDHLFRRHGLFLNEVQHLPIHGGSLRSFVGRKEKVGDSVKQMLAIERELGVDRIDFYSTFAERVRGIRTELTKILKELKAQGKRIGAYGASAKGSTMLSYLGIGPDLIEYVVDRNTYKQGKFMPGLHHPILSPDVLKTDPVDYLLLLVWNIKDEILRQQKPFTDGGGKFIVPIPSPHIA